MPPFSLASLSVQLRFGPCGGCRVDFFYLSADYCSRFSFVYRRTARSVATQFIFDFGACVPTVVMVVSPVSLAIPPYPWRFSWQHLRSAIAGSFDHVSRISRVGIEPTYSCEPTSIHQDGLEITFYAPLPVGLPSHMGRGVGFEPTYTGFADHYNFLICDCCIRLYSIGGLYGIWTRDLRRDRAASLTTGRTDHIQGTLFSFDLPTDLSAKKWLAE